MRRIVIGGQSRGAWNALQALDTPGLVDGVVAVAPAAHGATGSPAWAWALEDLRQVVRAARSPLARVVVANFAGDEFDPDPDRRATLFRSLARRGSARCCSSTGRRRSPGMAAGPMRASPCATAPACWSFIEGRAVGCG